MVDRGTYTTKQSRWLRAAIGVIMLLALMPLGALGGVQATGMEAAPLSVAAQATPVPDPDLCALLRGYLQGGVGWNITSSNPTQGCRAVNGGDGFPAPIKDIEITKYASPDGARSELKAKYNAATANNFGRWDSVTYFGDEGYGYEIMAINLNDPGGAFARGCYTVIGHSNRYPASNQPLIDDFVRMDQFLKSAPCGGGTPDKAPPDAITIIIPGKSAPCPYNQGLDTQIKLRVWSGPVRAENDKVPFFVKSSDGTTLGNTQIKEYVEYRYTTAAVDTMFTTLQPGYVVTLPSTVPKNTKDKWKVSAEFPDGTIVQLGPTGSLKIPCNPAEPLQMTGVTEILTKQSSTINTFSVGNANITAGSGRFFNALGPTNQADYGIRIGVNAIDPAKTGITVYAGTAQVKPNSGGTGVTVIAGQHVDVTQSSVTPPVAQLDVPGVDTFTFPETGKAAAGIFMDYWQTHGGLAQQGYPVSGLLREKSDLNGLTYTVQYFERAVFEFHPEYAAPNDVLLSQLGTFMYKKKYPNGAANQKPNQTAGNSNFFKETGHWVGGKFWTYWQTHGGLAQQGYPLSDEFTEVSETDGKTYTVQYFERAVFEMHPENAPPNDVLLSLLGNFFYKQKYGGGGGPGPVPTATPGGGGGGTNCSQTTNIASAPNGGSLTAASSSYGGDLGPEKMIDGNPATGWSSASGGKTNQYIIVALPRGQTYSINKVRLNPYTPSHVNYENDSIQDFEIRVSTTDANPASFTTVYKGTAPKQNAFFDYTFPTAQAKYVMLFIVRNYGGDWTEAREFEVYQACAGGGGNPTPPPVPTPTTVVSGECAGIPANQNMTVTPANCAKAGSTFHFDGFNFNPGEAIKAYATGPSGQVVNAEGNIVADQNGAVSGQNGVTLNTSTNSPTGIWSLTMEGMTSHKKAIGYIKILPP
ncbi:MAG TPA: discoidin domain-containing protein [Chloroflexia bacterium]|nr:discoidin domain-containing protein [Chloroflexia bacterium]